MISVSPSRARDGALSEEPIPSEPEPGRARGMPQGLYRRVAVLVAASDLAAFAAALAIVFVVDRDAVSRSIELRPLLVLFPVAQLIVFAAFRLYSLSRLSPGEE